MSGPKADLADEFIEGFAGLSEDAKKHFRDMVVFLSQAYINADKDNLGIVLVVGVKPYDSELSIVTAFTDEFGAAALLQSAADGLKHVEEVNGPPKKQYN